MASSHESAGSTLTTVSLLAGAPTQAVYIIPLHRDFNVNEIQLFQKQVAWKSLVHSLLCGLSSLQDQLLVSSLHFCSGDNSLMLMCKCVCVSVCLVEQVATVTLQETPI